MFSWTKIKQTESNQNDQEHYQLNLQALPWAWEIIHIQLADTNHHLKSHTLEIMLSYNDNSKDKNQK